MSSDMFKVSDVWIEPARLRRRFLSHLLLRPTLSSLRCRNRRITTQISTLVSTPAHSPSSPARYRARIINSNHHHRASSSSRHTDRRATHRLNSRGVDTIMRMGKDKVVGDIPNSSKAVGIISSSSSMEEGTGLGKAGTVLVDMHLLSSPILHRTYASSSNGSNLHHPTLRIHSLLVQPLLQIVRRSSARLRHRHLRLLRQSSLISAVGGLHQQRRRRASHRPRRSSSTSVAAVHRNHPRKKSLHLHLLHLKLHRRQ